MMVDALMENALAEELVHPVQNVRMENGESRGKPLSKEVLQRIVNMLDEGIKAPKIAEILDVHHRTVL